jgi:outer membrane lipoprotein SlyB
MSEVTSTGAVVAGTKGLWAAVGVLGVAVVGLGGALYTTVQEKTEPVPMVSAAPAEMAAAAPVAPAPVAEQPAAAPAAAPAKPRPAPIKKTQAPAETRPAPVAAAPIPAPVPVCGDCATVSAVMPVEREVPTGGTGAIAGGVLGAIVGNQVGRGSGRDAATIIGAIGGGIAGNQIEKKMKRVVAYQIELRMDDGSRRTLELDRPLSVGERVRYDGNTLQPLPASNG